MDKWTIAEKQDPKHDVWNDRPKKIGDKWKFGT